MTFEPLRVIDRHHSQEVRNEPKQAQSETKYRLLVLILKNLIEEGHITEEKIKSIRKAISKKYRPVIGWLEANE